jgi:ribosomal protein L11 methylase PrmA
VLLKEIENKMMHIDFSLRNSKKKEESLMETIKELNVSLKNTSETNLKFQNSFLEKYKLSESSINTNIMELRHLMLSNTSNLANHEVIIKNLKQQEKITIETLKNNHDWLFKL